MASKKGGRGGGFAAGWILRGSKPSRVDIKGSKPRLILLVADQAICVGFLVVVDIWWVIFFLFCFEVEDAVVVLQVSGCSRDQFSLLKAKSDSRPFQAYC